jgi:hypothetical protein
MDHPGKGATALRDPVAVAGLAEQPSGESGAFLQQLIEDAAEILGDGSVAAPQRIAKPSLTGELFDERAADPIRALNEVASGDLVDVDALTVQSQQSASAVRVGQRNFQCQVDTSRPRRERRFDDVGAVGGQQEQLASSSPPVAITRHLTRILNH